jgi:glycosyltransferase involved in cell wall biosynthesis
MNDKKIKLFVDAHCFDAEYQGSRTFVKEMYKSLANKKDVVIYLAAYDTENLKANFVASENIVFLKYRNKSSFLRLTYDIPRLIKKHRIDYAHFQYITPLIKNCRQVVTIHDVIFSDYPKEFSYPYRLLKKFLYKRSAHKADIVTTVSSFSKASIKKHLNYSTNIHVVTNGLNQHFFEQYDKEQAKAFIKDKYGLAKFILYVSRIEPRKNHLALLKAYLQLKLYEKGYQLAFVGHKTMDVPELENLLQSLSPSIKKHLYFNQSICDEDIIQFYRAAEFFIYPSKAEGFGIPPLEAAAARIPVICSNTSAMQEFSFFEDYHIDPSDEETLKQKLWELSEKKHDSSRLDAISEKIKSMYSWEQSAEKLYQLITTYEG